MSEPATSTATTTATPEDSTASEPKQPTLKAEEAKPKENGADVNEDSKLAAAAPAKPKYRHDWYQTPTDVYVNVMIKGLKNEDVSVNFEEKMASQMVLI